MLNGHKMSCPRCGTSLTELRISYLEYTNLSKEERTSFDSRLKDADNLENLSTTYRMYKYSKWYKELIAQTTGSICSFEPKRTRFGIAATN